MIYLRYSTGIRGGRETQKQGRDRGTDIRGGREAQRQGRERETETGEGERHRYQGRERDSYQGREKQRETSPLKQMSRKGERERERRERERRGEERREEERRREKRRDASPLKQMRMPMGTMVPCSVEYNREHRPYCVGRVCVCARACVRASKRRHDVRMGNVQAQTREMQARNPLQDTQAGTRWDAFMLDQRCAVFSHEGNQNQHPDIARTRQRGQHIHRPPHNRYAGLSRTVTRVHAALPAMTKGSTMQVLGRRAPRIARALRDERQDSY